MKAQLILLLSIFCIGKINAQDGPGGIGSESKIIFWLGAGENTSTTIDNDYVDTWEDKFGKVILRKKGDKPTFRNAPSKTLNGYPVISFDGNGDELNISNNKDINTDKHGYNERTFSIVLRTSENIVAKQLVYEEGGKSNGFNIYVDNSKLYATAYSSSNYQAVCSGDVSASTAYIVTVIFNSTSNNFSLYLNGALAQSVNGVTPMPSHTGGIGIGRINGATVFHDNDLGDGEEEKDNARDFNGDLVEFTMFNKAINTVERIINENYLGSKFSIELNSSISMNNMSSSVDGDFDYDVIGLGQASDGTKHTDSKGSGILRINNPDDLENNEFLLVGHNNAILGSYGTNDLPDGVEARIARVWKVAETGNIGNIDILLDLSSFGSVNASDLRLLIDANRDGIFANESNYARSERAVSGVFAGATDMGGGLYKFSSVNVENGQSFTVGSSSAMGTPLPISLVSFTAEIKGNNVHLNWITATEINNRFFTIEKSLDAKNWEISQIVEGAGISTTLKRYSVTDANPSNSVVYYRLKQTDFDGTSTHSDVVSVIGTEQLENVELTYNKSLSRIELRGLENMPLESLEVRIFNLNGQLITSKNTSSTFSISGLKGVYIVHVTSTNLNLAKKVIF